MSIRLLPLLLLSVSLGGGLASCSAQARAPERLPPPGLASRLEQIFGKKEFQSAGFGPVRWIEGGRAYTTLEDSSAVPEAKDIVRYEAVTGARSVLVPAASLVPAPGDKPLEIEDYSWTADESRALLYTNTRKVWRQNTRGDYWVLERADGRLRRLGGDFPASTLMFAKLSPDGTRAAYVQAGDLWLEELEGGQVLRLTSDGSTAIVNGTSDWVYEEEFDLRDGWRWSPDGKRIAFWHFDSSGVELFPLVNDTDTLYPTVRWIPYPKAGTQNSAVKIGVIEAAGGEPRWIELPGDARESYLPRMEWVPATGELLLQQMNRDQNQNTVWLADPGTGQAREFFRDQDATWLDVVDDWQWLPSGEELLWVSERDGWRHLWAVSRADGRWRCLTPGEFDALGVVGVDEARGLLYFQTATDDVTQRRLQRVALSGGVPQPVTPAGERGNHAYELGPSGELALHTSSRVDRPPRVELVRLPSHESVRVLESNQALVAKLAPLLASPTEFFQVEIGPGARLDGWLIRPPLFDPAGCYPLLLYVYGEPSSSQMVDGWKGARQLFHRALAEAGYVVACIDPRGTPAPRGRAARKEGIYRHMGARGAADIAAGLRALLSARPWLDPERVAVWGWSGGGTMTLHLLFRHPELFAAGLAVAPVPDARLYDSIYQERFLGLPGDNPVGYDEASPIQSAQGLEDPLLLVHGSGDDNVHFQGSERLIDRLVALGKPFDLMVYPNRTHAIAEGEGTSLHVHSLLARYLTEHLRPR